MELNNENDDDQENKENNEKSNNYTTNTASINMSALNTKKLGKKITIQLIKGPQGLGFKLAARDNCTPGEYSPIYIKNILPKGAAIQDGRLQRGDRLLEVNKQDMTQKTLHEAVNILRNTKQGACVEIVVSRQVIPTAAQLPREINDSNANEESSLFVPNENEITNEKVSKNPKRQLFTFEIALNETGSAGLGVSVKGKTKRLEDESTIDLGIFVKTVINGGAASKDGRLKPNDQLVNINGFSLLGKSNEEAMLILREAMMVESRPGHIELTISRKIKNNQVNNEILVQNSPKKREQSASPVRQVVKIIQHNNDNNSCERNVNNEKPSSRFNRDAPNRRSMSEKRTKIGQVPHSIGQSLTSASINKYQRNASLIDQQQGPKRSQTIQIIQNNLPPNYTTQTLNRQPKHVSNAIAQKISSIYSKSGNSTNIHPASTTRTDDDSDENFQRIGSFDSVIKSKFYLVFF